MVSFPNDGSAPFSLDGTSRSAEQAHHSQILCKRCQHGGVDMKVVDCGCFLHARCAPVQENSPLTNCPACQASLRSLLLMPMNFDELDEAKAAAASMSPSAKRGKKRKNATIARLNPSNPSVEGDGGDGSDLRTGRWTTEETVYCDELIERFDKGNLPISIGIKLNDFLANMLKSKQSRLTKKMKNARLSAKTYKRTNGYVADNEEAKEFSRLEKSFFDSIQCDMERAEIRFHMQKEWRELFSTYCVAMGQKLDADSWLSSVEEMDRRVSQAKDAARMARRKVMMGYALSQDSMNPEQGVFIERSTSTESHRGNEILSVHASSNSLGAEKRPRTGARSLRDFSSPFVGKVIQYMDRHQIPFEHIDAWVPSFVPNADLTAGGAEQKCRLCFAGFASTDTQIPEEAGRPIALSSQDQFDLLSFGEYSSKFSFDVGCGLPGRVYSSGICSWEQGVANAPSQQFERCGGASQWGIKTVLGIPIPSPNVGRIVVLLYSRHDRKRDPEMVRRITEELTKLMPTPKWKLVVDVGAAPPKTENAKPVDRRVADLLKLMAEHIPTHRNSPYSPYLPGFTSLRLLLVKQTKTPEEADLMITILESYSSYLSSGRSNSETAWMIARDYMLLSQSSNAAQRQQVQPQQPQQQQLQQPVQQQQQQQPVQQLQPQPIQQLQPQPAQLAQYHQVQQLQLQQAQQLHQQTAQQSQQTVQQQQAHQIHQQQVVLPQQVHHHQQALHPYSQPRQLSQMNTQPQSSTAGVVQHQVGVGLSQSHHHQPQPQHGISHQQPRGMSQQQSGTVQAAGGMHQQQKQHFVQVPVSIGSSQGNGVSQHQNGINTGSQLAPSPGFSVQQSAFQPINRHHQHATAHQQQNSHVGV